MKRTKTVCYNGVHTHTLAPKWGKTTNLFQDGLTWSSIWAVYTEQIPEISAAKIETWGVSEMLVFGNKWHLQVGLSVGCHQRKCSRKLKRYDPRVRPLVETKGTLGLWKGGKLTWWCTIKPFSQDLICDSISSSRISNCTRTLAGGNSEFRNCKMSLSCCWALDRQGSVKFRLNLHSKNM